MVYTEYSVEEGGTIVKLKVLSAVTEKQLEEQFNEFIAEQKHIKVKDTTFFATNTKFFAFITYI